MYICTHTLLLAFNKIIYNMTSRIRCIAWSCASAAFLVTCTDSVISVTRSCSVLNSVLRSSGKTLGMPLLPVSQLSCPLPIYDPSYMSFNMSPTSTRAIAAAGCLANFIILLAFCVVTCSMKATYYVIIWLWVFYFIIIPMSVSAQREG